jgi:hypothetical protein
VVIEGAASVDVGRVAPEYLFGRVPVVLSLHATKAPGTGEGGAVVWTDLGNIDRVTRALNFGFFNTRDSHSASINLAKSRTDGDGNADCIDGNPACKGSAEGAEGQDRPERRPRTGTDRSDRLVQICTCELGCGSALSMGGVVMIRVLMTLVLISWSVPALADFTPDWSAHLDCLERRAIEFVEKTAIERGLRYVLVAKVV